MTVLVGILTPTANVSVANNTFTNPFEKSSLLVPLSLIILALLINFLLIIITAPPNPEEKIFVS